MQIYIFYPFLGRKEEGGEEGGNRLMRTDGLGWGPSGIPKEEQVLVLLPCTGTGTAHTLTAIRHAT